MAYDPCRAIRVVVNTRTEPVGAERLVSEAVQEVSRWTGLRFEVEGFTDEAPSTERGPYQPDRYGERWAPVLVAWSDSVETRELDEQTAGIGGSTAVRDHETGTHVYVTGLVTLDGPQLAEQFGGATPAWTPPAPSCSTSLATSSGSTTSGTRPS